MKELTLEDFNLTPEELARLVAGAQTHFPVLDEDNTEPEADDENTVNNSDIRPTS